MSKHGMRKFGIEELAPRNRKGTKPEADATQAEVDEIKTLLFSTLEQTEEDYKAGKFKTYNLNQEKLVLVVLGIQQFARSLHQLHY